MGGWISRGSLWAECPAPGPAAPRPLAAAHVISQSPRGMWILGACRKGQKIWLVSAQMTSVLEELCRNRSQAGEKANVYSSTTAGRNFLREGFLVALPDPQHTQALSHTHLMPPGCHQSGSSSCRAAGWSQIGCSSLPELQDVFLR